MSYSLSLIHLDYFLAPIFFLICNLLKIYQNLFILLLKSGVHDLQGVPKEKSRKLTDFQDKSGHNSASEDMLLDAENSLSESFGGTIAARPRKNCITSYDSSGV